MPDVTVKRVEEMEAIWDRSFVRARASLGATSFGMNIWNFPPNWEEYWEHNHVDPPADDGEAVSAARPARPTSRFRSSNSAVRRGSNPASGTPQHAGRRTTNRPRDRSPVSDGVWAPRAHTHRSGPTDAVCPIASDGPFARPARRENGAGLQRGTRS
jgi:hypothetical protein